MSNGIDLGLIFAEIMFGGGRWFGLMIVVGGLLALSATIKYSGVIFGPALLFLSLEYLDAAEQDEIFVWFFVIALLASIFAFLNVVRQARGRS